MTNRNGLHARPGALLDKTLQPFTYEVKAEHDGASADGRNLFVNPRVRHGAFALAHPRGAEALRIFALLYFVVMAIRLAANINENRPDFWSEGAIPVAFHWVLALFIMVAGRPASSARGMRLPAEHGHEDDEADDIPHGDVPALAQPLACGPGLREQVGHSHARG